MKDSFHDSTAPCLKPRTVPAARRARAVIAVLAALTSLAGCDGTGLNRFESVPEPLWSGTRPPSESEPMSRPSAIVLLVADGGGFNQFKAASYYRRGSSPAPFFGKFDIALAATTFPKGGSYDPERAWTDFAYPPLNPTDSAAAATALSTGRKTVNGRIATDATGTSLKTVLERAESVGMLTGIVTSVPVSHATPAAFASHSAARDNYAAISNQMILDSGLDVLMGCGDPETSNDGNRLTGGFRYDWIPESVWNALLSGTAANDRDRDGDGDPWVLVRDASSIEGLSRSPVFSHVIAIPATHDTLQERRSGDSGADAFSVPFSDSVPSLAEMTVSALNLLSRGGSSFFLVVEGGAIDWANHANQSGRLIEETIAFEQTIEATLDWLAASGREADTLVIVTADHESGYLLGPGSGPSGFIAVANGGSGAMPGLQWNVTGHTNSLVPFFARGPNARHFANDISGFDSRRGWYVDNAAIGARLMGMLE
jgi:alkaline phosphatase